MVLAHIRAMFSGSRENLLFRRQYLLGPEIFRPNSNWNVNLFQNNLYLSSHKDIYTCILSSNQRTIGLVGYLIDPLNNSKGSEEILQELLENSASGEELLRNLDVLGGRWVIIFKCPESFLIVADPCGMRQVYFATDGRGFWCGSQPEIIRQVVDLKKSCDRRVKTFVESKYYGWQESAWVGDGTIYPGCQHLLPNHYLCLHRRATVRFFPDEPLPSVAVEDAVEQSSLILRGSIEGMAARAPLMLAVTAGYDSRVLLAASRNVRGKIDYYVDRMGILGEEHPDVSIPVQLASTLGLRFSVLNSRERVPYWFNRLNRMNVTRARSLPKSRVIYARYKHSVSSINVNGNASEICRNFFDKKLAIAQAGLTDSEISEILYGARLEFVVGEIDSWLKDLAEGRIFGYQILDLLYWEQRMGNWGAHFPAEQDVAIEEFSPFNNRRLLKLLLSCPKSLRAAPQYEIYRQIIDRLWPELLEYPFNPEAPPRQSFRQQVKALLRPMRF